MAEMRGKYVWAYFDGMSESGKTEVWRVQNGDLLLGKISFWSKWRRYAFFPRPETLYETQCMTDIAGFLSALDEKRKKARISP